MYVGFHLTKAKSFASLKMRQSFRRLPKQLRWNNRLAHWWRDDLRSHRSYVCNRYNHVWLNLVCQMIDYRRQIVYVMMPRSDIEYDLPPFASSTLCQLALL